MAQAKFQRVAFGLGGQLVHDDSFANVFAAPPRLRMDDVLSGKPDIQCALTR